MNLTGKKTGQFAGIALLCGCFLATGINSLYAQTSNTLANLSSGGSLAVDDKIFSNFSFQYSGLTTFDPTQIIVNASISGGIEYLTWSGAIQLASGIATGADLKLNYVVNATQGQINFIDQAYTGSAFNGFLAVDETASIGAFGGTVVGSSHLNNFIPSNPPSYSNDNLNIVPPQATLYVTKDISFATLPGGGFVTISQVAQSFHQVPEPATLAVTGIGGLGLLLLRRRK